MIQIMVIVVIGVLAFFPSCSTSSNRTTLQAPSERSIYFSAFPDFGGSEDHVSVQRIKDFETLAGKPLTWATFSDNWYNGITYPKAAIHAIHDAGAIPYVRLMPRSDDVQGHPEPHFTLQRIINGVYDTNLTRWAQDARADGIPLLIDFAVEMNGDWFPWSGVFNGGKTTDGYGDKHTPDGPERYRDAYRHIIDLFRAAGLHHVTWVFHVNLASAPDEAWNHPKHYYPGDDYIDWIGFSCYGAQTLSEEWEGLEFSTQLRAYQSQIRAISTRKPIAVLEFGVTDHHPDGNKSAWLDDAFATILNNPWITFSAINPWHEDWQNEDESWSRLRLDSSPEVTQTFRKWVSDPRFVSTGVWK